MLERIHRIRACPAARRAVAWLRGEAGDTMIEVVVAALIVALIAAATFVGFGSAADVAGAQRHEAEADVLAQQDEERLRGLSVTELSAIEPSGSTTLVSAQVFGNASYTQTIDGETYTITSTAKFVSASTGGLSCSSSGTSTADYIETASEVTWLNNNDGRPPIIEHSLVSPTAGGSLTTSVENSAGSPVGGATISVEGPGSSTSTQTLTTDTTGCAVFAGLAGGAYTVTATDPGYVTDTGNTNPSQSLVLLTGSTQTLQPFQMDQAAVQATFLTSINHASPTQLNWDTFSLVNTNETQSYGTPGGTPTSPISSGAVYPATYNAYAGTCSADDPGGSTGTTGLTGATYTDPTVSPASGTTGSVAVTVPTLLLQPILSYTTTTTTTTPVTTPTLPYTVKSYDSCPTTVGRTLTAPPNALADGAQTVYPVQAPYGRAVQVCFASAVTGTNTGKLPAASTIANTNLNGTTVTALTLPVTTGATGASAAFRNSGSCP
jgi:type II secretory pathway pseudopilin PulG